MSTMSSSEASSAVGRHREVLGLFHDREHLEGAADKLQGAGFDRSNLSLAYDRDLDGVPDPGPRGDITASAEVRKLRTLGTGLAGAVAALSVAGITLLSGGAAALAFGAAALAGSGAVGGAHALGQLAQAAADEGHAILIAQAASPELEARATEVLHEAGADKVWTQDAA